MMIKTRFNEKNKVNFISPLANYEGILKELNCDQTKVSERRVNRHIFYLFSKLLSFYKYFLKNYLSYLIIKHLEFPRNWVALCTLHMYIMALNKAKVSIKV